MPYQLSIAPLLASARRLRKFSRHCYIVGPPSVRTVSRFAAASCPFARQKERSGTTLCSGSVEVLGISLDVAAVERKLENRLVLLSASGVITLNIACDWSEYFPHDLNFDFDVFLCFLFTHSANILL